MLVVPKRHAATLAAVWASQLTDLLDACAERAWLGESQRFYVDQIALALAFGSGRFPHRSLPIEMNYLLGFDRPEALDPGTRRPVLLHVLHRMNFDTGRISTAAVSAPAIAGPRGRPSRATTSSSALRTHRRDRAIGVRQSQSSSRPRTSRKRSLWGR